MSSGFHLTIAHAELSLSKTVSDHPHNYVESERERWMIKSLKVIICYHHRLERKTLWQPFYCTKNHSLFAMVTIGLDVYCDLMLHPWDLPQATQSSM